MSVTTTTHLNLRGQAREALDLYASIFGGDVVAFTYGDAHVEADGAVTDELMGRPQRPERPAGHGLRRPARTPVPPR